MAHFCFILKSVYIEEYSNGERVLEYKMTTHGIPMRGLSQYDPICWIGLKTLTLTFGLVVIILLFLYQLIPVELNIKRLEYYFRLTSSTRQQLLNKGKTSANRVLLPGLRLYTSDISVHANCYRLWETTRGWWQHIGWTTSF